MPCINNAEAKRILEQLFEGINPLTGEYFPKQHVYNDPNVIRALYTAVNALNACIVTPTMRSASEQTEKCISSIHANRNKSWTPEEDQNLRHAHGYGATYDQMAAQLLRSPRLIKCRPVYLGLASRKIPGWSRPTSHRQEHQELPWYPQEDTPPLTVHPHARGADLLTSQYIGSCWRFIPTHVGQMHGRPARP